ncbi:hypothetical protein F8O01_02285 [Pseudoclavibacter chungangensis]|uniref:Uncharacterized protein n=1 Tax=Pseudoclavibacter chungangensis TaxID=587635 RepID=A0A7J5C3G2_9MICO|nr:hypothetical protein [Pseudoclavibacter chungangensis]KAB1662308.1 hypothetical protein F8O01_02285 [Pseudoclavibacter chungangensis]NYJ65517.1 hypothetical protein [Pseudoclavibacter chungangensis]
MTCICPRLAITIWCASVAVVGIVLVMALGAPALVEIGRHVPDIGARVAMWVQSFVEQIVRIFLPS